MALTLLLYVLAHSCADFAAERLRAGEPLRFDGFRRTVLREAWLLPGAGIPLLIWWAFGASLSAAVLAAVWTSAGTVLALELAAGIRADLSRA